MKSFLQLLGIGCFIVSTLSACNNKSTTSGQTSNQESSVTAPADNRNSIYQLTDEWVNADNEPMTLSQLGGKVQLIAMVFTHCGYACPRIVQNIKDIQEQLPKALRDQVGCTLVSFDVIRDTPQRLRQYAQNNDLDPQHWTLLHGNEDQVRTLSMLLHVQYTSLDNGNFDHSNILTVLDKHGNIAAQFEGLKINQENVVTAIKKII